MYTQIQLAKSAAKDAVDILFLSPAINRAAGDVPPAWSEAVKHALKRPEITAEFAEITRHDEAGRSLLLAGLGDVAAFTPRRLRALGGHIAAQLYRMRASAVRLSIGPLTDAFAPRDRFTQGLVEGIALGSFVYDAFKKDARRLGPATLKIHCADAALTPHVQRGLSFADTANYARQLAATPPNIANPRHIAEEARKLARPTGLRCTVYTGKELQRRRFAGLLNVGAASRTPPCLIELIYTPRKKPTRTVALVGKTITFDTGGLSLKLNNSMRHMKYDKCGGMAVLAVMRHVAALKPDFKVVALLPAAENMISSTGYRPDDILRYANGVTVEVTNTDAEGRLVLADALVHACRAYRPDALIDLATLTGGVVTALGTGTAGLWCADDDLRRQIQDAADRAGEPVWPMPIAPEHREAIRSEHADIVNSTLKPTASPCIGAAFLSRFVEPGVRWAHLDIAGVADTETASAPFAIGPTGFGVRLLLELLSA